MAISIGGYIINLTVYQAFYILILNKLLNIVYLWQLGFIPGILLNIGASANAIVLYNTRFSSKKNFK
jgi:hypothetical protein